MNMFRRLIFASAGAIALSGAALAAEPLPPPPPPPPLWTGFYLGLNAGGTWSSNSTVNTSAIPGPCDTTSIFTIFFCTPTPNFSATSAALATFSVSHNNGGFIGGGQGGYNYQLANSWVAGIETDIQGVAGSSGNATVTSVLANPNFPGTPIFQTATVSRQVDWLGTLRGRLGFLATPTFLVYGTGGLAFGGVSATTNITQATAVTQSIPIFGLLVGPSSYFSVGSLSDVRVGWTAGGGVEWMFLPNWSLKVEYLYYNLGNASFALSPLVNRVPAVPVGRVLLFGGVLSSAFPQSTTRFDGNIVRAGIDYHFIWPPAPVVAKY
jgi:outer membrane immunogenic protein